MTTLPRPQRHPAGTDVEPVTVLPAAESRGTTATGLVVLETPADPAAARSVVAAFFRAIVEESPRALAAVLGDRAMMQEGSRREAVATVFAGRFARYDYRSLMGEALYRDSDVKAWREDDDLMLRVSVDVAWGTRPRMFGDELTFRLSPDGSSWLIVEVLENFRNP